MTLHKLLILIGVFVSAAAAAAQKSAPPTPPPPRIAAIDAAFDTMLAGLGSRPTPAGLSVIDGTEVVHQNLRGGLAVDAPMPIASASKWLAVATILSVVDEGLLELDAPVAEYVVELDRPDKRTMTLRQCMSCTAGWSGFLLGEQPGWGSDEFAVAAGAARVRTAPGAAFRYGGVTFQIAAIAAERVTGKDWHTLFAERIASPLGMTATKFAAMRPFGADPGTTRLPAVAGGAISTLADYTKFVQMLLGDGDFAGRCVLSPESVALMLSDQVAAAVDVRMPGDLGTGLGDVRYGLGTWLLRPEGTWLRACDPGAFGFTPWIDRDLGVGGVLAIRDRSARVLPRLAAVQAAVREACGPQTGR
jgi:CubicO group peptidase (beta-lactamase class C family)